MAVSTLVSELRREQSRIAEGVTTELLALYGAFNFKAIDATAPAFIEASVSVADRWHRKASEVGGDMYLSMRSDAGVAGHYTVDRPQFNERQLRRDLIILGPVAAKKALSSGARIPTAARNVFTLTAGRVSTASLAGVRDTISRTSVRDAQVTSYARQTQADACDFCLMLAENTYKDAYSAMYSSGSRKRAKSPQPMGSKFHDHCRCVLVPLFRGGPVTEVLAAKRDREKRFREAWAEASGQSERVAEILAARAGV